ncbi:MAG: NUDIX hydrolase [Bryobacteraceae bacterium]|nr:NUDIX hydrolase [Bryobacteraceae bacterium]
MLGVGALIFEGETVLLVERGREPLKGYWSLPGGVLETGERLEEGIRREVLEETGLQVEIVGLAEIFERIILDGEGKAEYHYVLIDYVCRVSGGTLEPSDDASRAAWVPVAELGNYLLTEGTREVVEKAYRRFRQEVATKEKQS